VAPAAIVARLGASSLQGTASLAPVAFVWRRGSSPVQGAGSVSVAGALYQVGRNAPDAIIALDGYDGVLANVQDDPDSPDANWLTLTAA
jgi:hypothetical protein